MTYNLTFVNKIVGKVWLALAVAYIALLPSFYLIYTASNRITLLWSLRYYASIISAIVILGLTYFIAYMFLRTTLSFLCKRGREVIAYFCVWGMICIGLRTIISILDRAGWLDATPFILLRSMPFKLACYGILPALLFFLVSRRRLIKGIVNGYYVVSPALFLLIICPLYYGTGLDQNEHAPEYDHYNQGQDDNTALPNIYIFLLDEWDYDYTQGMLEDEICRLPRLSGLRRESTWFTKAYSPGPTTLTSIPRFLFQSDPEFPAYSYEQIERIITQQRDYSCYANIFDVAGDQFFRVSLGLWHNYPDLVGHSVDVCAKIHNEAAWRTYRSELMRLLYTQLGWLRYLGITVDSNPAPPSVVWIYSLEEIHRQALTVIRDVKIPTFAFFHYCIPHYPYIWNGQGKKDIVYSEIEHHTKSNYMNNLAYSDRLIGELLDELNRAEKYETSLLIFTSDHAWRFNPDAPAFDVVNEDQKLRSRWKHVPLIIKFPGQHRPHIVTNDYFTSQLYELIIEELGGKAFGQDVESR